jgi:hypothetical protein
MYLKLVANNPYPQFDVYDEDRLIVRIKIDTALQAFRIMIKDNRRVFFIDEEKLQRNNICTLLNEYSQPLGTLVRVMYNTGEVEVEGLKLNYRILSKPVKEIILFEHIIANPTLNCRMSDAVIFEYSNYINYFIFALSWFTFLSKEKNEIMSYASA